MSGKLTIKDNRTNKYVELGEVIDVKMEVKPIDRTQYRPLSMFVGMDLESEPAIVLIVEKIDLCRQLVDELCGDPIDVFNTIEDKHTGTYRNYFEFDYAEVENRVLKAVGYVDNSKTIEGELVKKDKKPRLLGE